MENSAPAVNVFIAFGSLFALASACCAAYAAYLVTPLTSTASQKTAQLIRMLRDYTWASRGVVAALERIVLNNAPIIENFETERLSLANAIRQYLGGV